MKMKKMKKMTMKTKSLRCMNHLKDHEVARQRVLEKVQEQKEDTKSTFSTFKKVEPNQHF